MEQLDMLGSMTATKGRVRGKYSSQYLDAKIREKELLIFLYADGDDRGSKWCHIRTHSSTDPANTNPALRWWIERRIAVKCLNAGGYVKRSNHTTGGGLKVTTYWRDGK